MPERQELTIREQLEAREIQYLSQYAKLSEIPPEESEKKDNVIFARSFKETETAFYTVSHFGV